MGYVLGVDGGNTKTLALVGQLDGTIVGVGRGGCSDIYAASSPEAALAEVEKAVSDASDEGRGECVTLAYSACRADWSKTSRFGVRYSTAGFEGSVIVVTMGWALSAAHRRMGVVVVCGTVRYGRRQRGQVAQSGQAI